VQPLTLSENQEFLRAFFTPDLLPAFNVQLDRIATTDDRTPPTLDRVNTRAMFSATYTLAQKLDFAYTFTDFKNEDHVINRTLEQRSQVASANYTDSFFNSRLTVNGNYLFTRVNNTETFTAVAAAGGGPVLLPVIISRAFGLTEFDPAVPNQSKLPPVQCNPAAPPCTSLSNGTSTALSITANLVVDAPGPPNTNESLIFGLSPGASVSTVRLTVSSRPGDPRDIGLQAAGVTFQIFGGTNLNVDLAPWTQIPITSVTPPTVVNPYFEISFAATGGTFLKIHVAGDTQQPAFPPLVATTIEGFITGAAAGAAGLTNRLTTSNTLQSLTANITAQPINALTVNANGSYSTNRQDPLGRTDNNANYTLTATGTPHRLLTVTGTYQASFTTSSDPQTLRTDQSFASLTLSSVPLPTLTASLSGTRSENEVGGAKQTQTTSVIFNTAAKPYRNLNVDLTTTTSQTENFLDGSKTDTFSGTLNANAILTDRLSGLLGERPTVPDVHHLAFPECERPVGFQRDEWQLHPRPAVPAGCDSHGQDLHSRHTPAHRSVGRGPGRRADRRRHHHHNREYLHFSQLDQRQHSGPLEHQPLPGPECDNQCDLEFHRRHRVHHLYHPLVSPLAEVAAWLLHLPRV
jgi:hypothetical protein